MEDAYKVTRHQGSTPTCILSGTVLYSTYDSDVAWRFYNLLRPSLKSTIAIWKPDGTLLSSKSGPTR
jgi:hypothetical protein